MTTRLTAIAPTLVPPNADFRPTYDQISQQFQRVADVVNNPASGVTAARPSGPAVGEPYFDTTLGIPIWWRGAMWVDATGSPV